MRHLSRRHLLAATPLAGLAVLAGCTTTTSGGSTTYTFDFAKIEQVGPIAIQGVSNLLASPSIAAVLGATTVATVNGVLAAATKDFASVAAAIGPSQTLTIDSTSFVTLGTTFLSDVQKASGLVSPLLAGNATASTYISALDAAITALQLAFALAGAASKPNAMALPAALAVLSKPAK